MSLAEFLLARIAEDEEFFRTYDIEEPFRRRLLAECKSKRRIVELETGSYVYREDLPADLTPIGTEWRSDREWVHVNFGDGRWEQMSTQTHRERFMRPADSEVLRLLALPYADHPDYREEWRP